jgi:hypothetical protein
LTFWEHHHFASTVRHCGGEVPEEATLAAPDSDESSTTIDGRARFGSGLTGRRVRAEGAIRSNKAGADPSEFESDSSSEAESSDDAEPMSVSLSSSSSELELSPEESTSPDARAARLSNTPSARSMRTWAAPRGTFSMSTLLGSSAAVLASAVFDAASAGKNVRTRLSTVSFVQLWASPRAV